jgi:bifunctional UDP-N-acetylglucosamine pyrophosphorylase / glucosamine-1-phosphate N-acetyltransferase
VKKEMATAALILAGGKGTRMKSDIPKALFKVGNDTIIEHIVNAVSVKAVTSVAVVVSPSNIDPIKSVLGSKVEYILQPEAKGTGHAVMCAEPALKGQCENVIVFVGDAPFITQDMVTDLIDTHVKKNNACTFFTAFYEKGEIPPYGRIVRDHSGRILKVVEEKDASQEQKAVREVLTSHYCFKTEKLFGSLKNISDENSGKEYYLTDVIGILIDQGETVEAIRAEDPIFLAGINTQEELELRTKEMNEYIRDQSYEK